MASLPVRDPIGDHLLTPQNAASLVIDYQPSQFAGVRSMDRDLLLENIVSTVKTAKAFDMPIVHSTVNVATGLAQPTVLELAELLEDNPPVDRTTTNAWEDADFLAAVRATGRRKLILCALWTEICMAFPALDALQGGLRRLSRRRCDRRHKRRGPSRRPRARRPCGCAAGHLGRTGRRAPARLGPRRVGGRRRSDRSHRAAAKGMSVENNLTDSAVGAEDRRRWLALAVIVTAQFMVVLDIAIVNVALPSIQADLQFSPENLQWVITGYSIFFGGFLLLGGRLADLLGRRRLLMAGLLVFTVSSLLNGLAWSEGSLIAFRCLQGLGAAMFSPAALSILTTTFQQGRERNRALGIWGAVAGSGGAAGVLLGGVLTSSFSWPWIFYINVPVGAAVIAISPMLLRESRADLANRYFDLAGAATITSGVMLLVYAMTRATQQGWGSSATIGLLTVSDASDRLVLRDRIALQGPSVASTHLAAADAAGVEHKRLDRGRRCLLAVSPAHAVHAARSCTTQHSGPESHTSG